MTTEWALYRRDGLVRGTLRMGDRAVQTLEPAAHLIPAGRYPLALTLSGRAQRGSLWTPDEGRRLPELVGVPGRTAIRIHAGNTAADSLGCILVGLEFDGEALRYSRVALMLLMRLLKTDTYLTVTNLEDTP
jgi:hypothetical protein